MSGIRNDPPISISSPRLMMHLAPRRDGVERQHQRAGGVVHHQRIVGAGEPGQQRAAVIGAAARGRRRAGRTRGWCIRRPRLHGVDRRLASGARPRLVCSTMPVALSTGAREGATRGATSSAISAAQSSGGPARRFRDRSMASRAAPTTAFRGAAWQQRRTPRVAQQGVDRRQRASRVVAHLWLRAERRLLRRAAPAGLEGESGGEDTASANRRRCVSPLRHQPESMPGAAARARCRAQVGFGRFGTSNPALR